MPFLRFLALALMCAPAVLARAACQLPEPPAPTATTQPQPSSTLLVRLKSRSLTLDEARPLCAELRTRPTRVRLQASAVLRAAYLREHKQFEKLAEHTLDDCRKLAQKTQKQLLGRRSASRIDELRAGALQVSRRQDLNKQLIHDEIDPRLAELRGLLLPTVEQVLDSDQAVTAALETLRLRQRELGEWFALYADMLSELGLDRDAERHFEKHPAPDRPGGPETIDNAVAAAAFDGLPMSDQDQKSLAANQELQGRIDHEEWLGTLALNRLRYLLGLSLVRIDAKLCDAARDHSRDMHERGFFSHRSPVEGKETVGQRASNFGTSASAENIAAGQSTGEGAIRGWYYSPGHHRNMLADHRRTGLGRHEQLWTQLFGN